MERNSQNSSHKRESRMKQKFLVCKIHECTRMVSNWSCIVTTTELCATSVSTWYKIDTTETLPAICE